MRPMRITVLASFAVAVVACGIDALGTMPVGGVGPSVPSTPGTSGTPGGDEGDADLTKDASTSTIEEDGGAITVGDGGIDAADDASLLDAAPDGPITRLLELTRVNAPATVNLTNEGTTDWAYWGANGNTPPVRKVAPNVISTLTVVYNELGSTGSGFGTTFSWSNATNGSGSSDAYLYVKGNAGVSETFKVPSGPTKQTVVVWVGGNEIRGKLTARLVDGTSTLEKVDSSQQSQSGTFGSQYTIDFRSLSATQLEVKWEIDQTFGVNSLRFTAVALR